jgi:shikimate kinase
MMIFLCGFSGSGKSRLLNLLKATSGDADWSFFDLDGEITKGEGLEIREIVSRFGFDHFRDLETLYLKRLMKNKATPSCIVALGGGALDKNLNLLRTCRQAQIVWLNVPFETCYGRIVSDIGRPLVNLGKETLSQLFAERTLNYQKADLVLSDQQIENIKKLNQLLDLLK